MRRLKIGLLTLALAIVLGSLAAGPSNPALAGGLDIMDSVIELDVAAGTVKLPLFKGTHGGVDVFYIITESSDEDDAEDRGVNESPKLANAIGFGKAVQLVTASSGVVAFDGTVDFSPVRSVTPNPDTGFPPLAASPGSIGDDDYSPLIEIDGSGIVLNAPQLVHGSDLTELHDSVVSIDFGAMTVTLGLVPGFYHGHEILYISTDVSNPVVAALEASTFALNMNDAPGLGSNDEDTSARSGIIPVVNGQRGVDNPERQGLQSALLGEGAPLNITQEHPGTDGYTPLWDVHPAVWTQMAIDDGERVLLDHHKDVEDAVEDGLIVSGGAGPRNPDFGGLRAAGFIVNCPIMAVD